MQLHDLQKISGQKDKKRVGRGGKRGKTSGRGMKGQNARANTHKRPELRDTIKKLPKLRGHGKNRARTVNDSVVKAIPVNLAALDDLFDNGDVISPKTLVKKKIISRGDARRFPVKILGNGTVSKSLTVEECRISIKAQELLEKAGGSVKK